MQGYKTVAEVVAALGKVYDGPTQKKKGSGGKTYDYIPWQVSAEMLNEVFGPLGWDSTVTTVVADTQKGIYASNVKITARVLDSETDELVTISRENTGVGLVNGEFADAHDTAIKGAASDGLSRAAKLLGKAFGLGLYDKPAAGDNQSQQSTGTQGSYQKATADSIDLSDLMSRQPQVATKEGYFGNVSPAQATHAQKKGWTPQALARLTGSEVRVVMDGVFGKGPEVAAPREAVPAF